jgi:hypothetical protein
MKHYFTIILILCVFFATNAQQKVYFFGSDYGEITSEENAVHKKIVFQRNSEATKIKSFVIEDGKWKQEKIDKLSRTKEGKIIFKSSGNKLFAEKSIRTYMHKPDGDILFNDYVKGKLIRSGTTSRELPLNLQDTIKLFYAKGSLKSIAWYEDNRLLGNHNWLKDGSPYIDNIHYYVDEIPEHSNGQVFFRHYMLNGIKEAGIDLSQISDRVVIGMVINDKGDLDGLHVSSGIFKELNETLISLIRVMPGNWVPATLHGKHVNYYMEIPFNFRHIEEGFDSLELSSGFVVWD